MQISADIREQYARESESDRSSSPMYMSFDIFIVSKFAGTTTCGVVL